ncbi:uncharacterized protein LOC134824489 [Bolinopsis microptera]
MIRSHSLPEIYSKTAVVQGSSKDQGGVTADKSFPKTMKLKRHRSQLCLQQSFDTITEEEEEIVHGTGAPSTFEKLETIKGSFSQSVDSVINLHGSAPVKPSTQFNTSINDMLVENTEYVGDNADNADPSDYSLAETTENTTASVSLSSEKKSAKLKRQSCEEVYQ